MMAGCSLDKPGYDCSEVSKLRIALDASDGEDAADGFNKATEVWDYYERFNASKIPDNFGEGEEGGRKGAGLVAVQVACQSNSSTRNAVEALEELMWAKSQPPLIQGPSGAKKETPPSSGPADNPSSGANDIDELSKQLETSPTPEEALGND